MRRFLIVGCGGSGGATIRFIQDQLLADLRPEGTHELPDAWQFVHIDVPTTPDSGPPPLGSVRDMGGRYLSVSSLGNTYGRAAAQVFQGARQRLDTVAGWVPPPKQCTVPVTEGAGQFRAVGRTLTLTRLTDVQTVLNQAFEDLQKPDPWAGLSSERRAKVGVGGDIIPIVIGSMAGGSGASMFLDVCRLLGRINGIDPLAMGAFLFSSDVFRTLPAEARLGVEGNALGAIGDIIAAQTGLSALADRDLLTTLGVTDVPEFAFARVFPIGSAIGGDGAVFGDGTPMGIYRGIGRALAALILSDAQNSYVAHTVGNPTPPSVDSDVFGWGTKSESFAWGSFGYASLSLGRDRYSEYAAQRLARSCADRLMHGHMDPVSQLPSGEQLKAIIDAQWGPTLQRLQLPGVGEDPAAWFRSVAMDEAYVRQESRRIVNEPSDMVSETGSAPAADWLNAVSSRLPLYRESVRESIGKSAYAWVDRYGTALERRVLEEFLDSVMRLGLPYGREYLTRLQAHLEVVINTLQQAPDPNGFDPLALEQGVGQRVVAMKRAVIASGHELVELVRSNFARSTGRVLQTTGARLTAAVLESFKNDVLGPLVTASSHVLLELEASRESGAVQAGLAQLRTDIYREWPGDSDEVPTRFAHADNEILLTVASEFPGLYADHVVRTVGGSKPYKDALSDIVGQIIRGRWETQGGQIGEIPVHQVRSIWRAPVLSVDAESGAPTPRSAGAYSFDLQPAKLLERARLFLERENEPFATYRKETVGEYLSDARVPVPQLEARKEEFARKFNEALRLARPLVGVNAAMVQAMHPGKSLTYTYVIGNIGLRSDDPVVGKIRASIEADATMDPSVMTALESATGDGRTESRIAIFGSYPKYSPVVFSSLLDTVQDRFATIPDVARSDLWRWKSTRPLAASLPMSQAELHALVAGWFLGRLTGRIRIGSANEPVVVWDDETSRWLPMPWPMLTDPSTVPEVDWLPIVLESYTLALVQCNRDTSLHALRPFRALRRIWDTTAGGPAGALAMDGLAATRHISAWLESGKVDGADPSVVVPDAAGMTADERRTAARTWIAALRGWLEKDLVVKGSGSDYGRILGKIESPEQAFMTPKFVALAPHVYDVLSELDQQVENAPVTGGSMWGQTVEPPPVVM